MRFWFRECDGLFHECVFFFTNVWTVKSSRRVEDYISQIFTLMRIITKHSFEMWNSVVCVFMPMAIYLGDRWGSYIGDYCSQHWKYYTFRQYSNNQNLEWEQDCWTWTHEIHRNNNAKELKQNGERSLPFALWLVLFAPLFSGNDCQPSCQHSKCVFGVHLRLDSKDSKKLIQILHCLYSAIF